MHVLGGGDVYVQLITNVNKVCHLQTCYLLPYSTPPPACSSVDRTAERVAQKGPYARRRANVQPCPTKRASQLQMAVSVGRVTVIP